MASRRPKVFVVVNTVTPYSSALYAAVTRLERAENLLADGRADEAGPLVAAARETFEELRARPWVERAEALALGAKVPA